MKKVSGLALIAIGLLHSLIALVFPGILGFSGIWPEIVNAGIVDAANAEALRIWGYYWLLMPGFLLIVLGLYVTGLSINWICLCRRLSAGDCWRSPSSASSWISIPGFGWCWLLL